MRLSRLHRRQPPARRLRHARGLFEGCDIEAPKREYFLEDKAPWAQADAGQEPPGDIDFPPNGDAAPVGSEDN